MKFLILLALTLTLTMANEVALQEFTTGNNLFTAAIYRVSYYNVIYIQTRNWFSYPS
ncbi:hypothetical protein TcasGA2_TC032044 [Tribolium castaneum]|uniref:Uncharacterized protein n=1 Tax=Tribolium castaneum TaxID=7070 RepID=A0A139WM12_TRICA|nr:hypothetical protein TcasGA2_TC032044 [Tribolium castaneum]